MKKVFGFSMGLKSKADKSRNDDDDEEENKSATSIRPRRNLQGSSALERRYDDYQEDDNEIYADDDYQPQHEGNSEGEEVDVITSAQVVPSDREKTGVLSFLAEMRKESSFCDISFMSRGEIFRAHKVVISSWSRWLRSLLLEGSADQVMSLDIFEPSSLGAVLDYMYGSPLLVTVETADDLLKVVRRLEMTTLEQQIWRFLITAIDESNCDVLHDLADIYDCPPLKLAAFRVLQESDPAYATAPVNWDTIRSREQFEESKFGSGLTGPGEISFYNGVGTLADNALDYEDDEDRVASILDFNIKVAGETEDAENDGDEGVAENSAADVVYPDQLPPNATAREVVRAWTARLQLIYEQCMPTTGEDGEEEGGDDDGTANMILNYSKDKAHMRRQRMMGLAVVDAGSVNWKQELKRFYLAVHKPEKLPHLDEILETWRGKEEAMLAQLLVKYRKSIPPALLDHFLALQSAIESQTREDVQAERADPHDSSPGKPFTFFKNQKTAAV